MENLAVRRFSQDDRAQLRDVFHRAGDGEPSPFGRHEESVWLAPYMDLEPDSLFVATVDGEIVGYLTGCLDSAKLPSAEDHIRRLIAEERLLLSPGPLLFLMRSMLDIAMNRGRTASGFDDPRWPSHFHIRLAPEARGRGLGTMLIGRWQERLREAGSPGCHVEPMLENAGAVALFARMGFEKHGEALMAPGFRGARGERQHVQVMVWSPEGGEEAAVRDP